MLKIVKNGHKNIYELRLFLVVSHYEIFRKRENSIEFDQ